MTRPFVHIGFPKTASTWFQRQFYPHVRNYHVLKRELIEDVILAPTAFHFDAAEARQALDNGNALPPLLSNESLVGSPDNGGLNGHLSAVAAERIKAIYPDARIAMFIRAQPSMIASNYYQYLRAGGTSSFRRYAFGRQYLYGPAKESYRTPYYRFEYLEYDRLIAHYDALFGRENVHIFLYEEFRAGPQAMLNRFRDLFDMEATLPGAGKSRENRSFGRRLLLPARFFNMFTARKTLPKRSLFHIPGWYLRRKKLLNRMSGTGLFGKPYSPRELMGDDMFEWIEARYGASNRALAGMRPDLPIDRFGYPVTAERPLPLPEPSTLRKWYSQ